MKKIGFTLAEVLITLGIIGVVAAMTIPNLIANTRSSQYRSAFKKAVSTLSQAARMSQAQYGFDYAGISEQCGTNAATEHPDEIMSFCAILNGTLTGATYYPNVTDVKMNQKGQAVPYSVNWTFMESLDEKSLSYYFAYTLADGTLVGVTKKIGSNDCALSIGTPMSTSNSTVTTMSYCYGFIDVNGASLPNREVSCSSGSNKLEANTCIVKNDAQHMTDIYPVRFHDGIVEPATAAARYVLKTAK